MKHIKEFGIIILISCVGEFVHYLLPLPVPSSIYGLLLMLLALVSGIVKLEQVKTTGNFLIEIMPLMFIPAAVGLLNAWVDLQKVLLPVLLITVISTIFVMVTAGRVTQFVIRKGRGNDYE